MPIYEFRCRECRGESEEHRALGDTAPPSCCGMPMGRKYTLAFRPVMQSHFNHSVGQEVHSPQHMKRILADKSAAESERLGMDVRYAPVDLRDNHGVTEEGMDATRRQRVKDGKEQVKLWL